MQTDICNHSPLSKSISKHFVGLSVKDKKRVMRSVAQFTAGLIDTRMMKTQLKMLGTHVCQAAAGWRTWALGSYYWGSLWRAVVTQDPEHWQVEPDDVDLIRGHLTTAEKRQLQDLYLFRSVERLKPEVIMDLHRQLHRFAWKIYYKKLRFVSMHDPGMPSEDLVADLLESGFRVLRRYEHQQDPQKTLNYARRSIVNRANNLTVYFSRPSRARLLASNNRERDYFCRVVSLGSVQAALERKPVQSSLFDTIRIELGSQYEEYARALLGQWPAFDSWVAENHNQKPEKLPENVVEKYARQFSGLTSVQTQQNLAPLLIEELSRDYLASSHPT